MGSYIIAIDFGTAFTSYGIDIETNQERTEIYWKCWDQEVGRETRDTPTCILFDEQQQFVSFGYEAIETSLCQSRDTRLFFFDFSEISLDDKKFTRDLTIKAADGREMKALDVFAEALGFLQDDALKFINSHGKVRLTASDFTWVLTVPDNWDDSAELFIREAASQAGIVTDIDRLVIALRSEAALSWCMKLPGDGFITESREQGRMDRSPGTQYVVVLCEEDISHIAVYEVVEGGELKELQRASYKDLRKKTVERNFMEFMREIFSDGIWDEYERKHPSEVKKILYNLNVLNKRFKDIEISCSLNLIRLAERRQSIEKFFETVEGASWDEGAISISQQKLRSFFAQSMQDITHNLREILNKDFNISGIMLVGKYAHSEILRNHITEEFIDICEVLCPFMPQYAILNGAAEIGKYGGRISRLRSAFTYGIGVSERFDELKHREDRTFTNKDGKWCGGLFIKLGRVGEQVSRNKTIEFTFYPVEADQIIMNFYFYRTKKKFPKYVTEDGVEEVGCLFLTSPKTGCGRSRETKLRIEFGNMEMKASAKDLLSKSESSTVFDLNEML
ncbi:heat shock 70 kDa protein 12A-like [Cyprinodon tularosa]|uniref:heat shock 70 kDa protein 12A-like n=1 Tax=Cyprinodon tularosa TaxID=77115 RepID=UPI0018E27395|nr:heat shock 70 kDa protein 12A-like [Cyprinodon tularosa]